MYILNVFHVLCVLTKALPLNDNYRALSFFKSNLNDLK